MTLISLGIFTILYCKRKSKSRNVVNQLQIIRNGMENLKVIDPNSNKTIAMLVEKVKYSHRNEKEAILLTPRKD